ncbi:MAG: VTC domain-containing protein [Kiritimatiellia bacterium]
MFSSAISKITAPFAGRPKGLTNELKFVGHPALAADAIGLLAATCLPDPLYPVGYIHSIYFDTLLRDFWAAKKEGDHLKQKVRIRWYGTDGPPQNAEIPAFIEVKNRIGSARDKSRIKISAPAPWIQDVPLEDPSVTAFLYQHAPKLMEPIPMSLVPVICISYARRRYVCPLTGSRIALDTQIRAERLNATQFPAIHHVQVEQIVCEFKNQGKTLPDWVEQLYSLGLRLRSFSKFGECMNQILHGGIPV